MVAKAFEAEGAEFCISAISIWETMLAVEKRRIETAEEVSRAWLAGSPIIVTPIDAEIAMLSRTLAFEHTDPADRFIAATAYRLGCLLAAVDERLCSLPWLRVLS